MDEVEKYIGHIIKKWIGDERGYYCEHCLSFFEFFETTQTPREIRPFDPNNVSGVICCERCGRVVSENGRVMKERNPEMGVLCVIPAQGYPLSRG